VVVEHPREYDDIREGDNDLEVVFGAGAQDGMWGRSWHGADISIPTPAMPALVPAPSASMMA
jgi:hypothetical protein